jgi:hypothetical protein
VVGVAHGRGSDAAADGAAQVPGGEVAALRGGDRVPERLEAADLSEGGEQHPGDAGIAQQRLDPAAGLRPGPGGGGARLLGADPALPRQGGRDGVGEAQGLVVGAPRAARGAGGCCC